MKKRSKIGIDGDSQNHSVSEEAYNKKSLDVDQPKEGMIKRSAKRISELPNKTQERLAQMKESKPEVPLFFEKDSGLTMEYQGDEELAVQTLIAAFGVDSWPFVRDQLVSISHASSQITKSTDETGMVSSSDVAAIASIAPNDAIESMLASQMVTTHRAAMRALATLNASSTTDQINSVANCASKLMNLYVKQVETLNKHRGKGQQKMTVEHVHVNEGGQAIIGSVEGGRDKKGGQPHALRCKD